MEQLYRIANDSFLVTPMSLQQGAIRQACRLVAEVLLTRFTRGEVNQVVAQTSARTLEGISLRAPRWSLADCSLWMPDYFLRRNRLGELAAAMGRTKPLADLGLPPAEQLVVRHIPFAEDPSRLLDLEIRLTQTSIQPLWRGRMAQDVFFSSLTRVHAVDELPLWKVFAERFTEGERRALLMRDLHVPAQHIPQWGETAERRALGYLLMLKQEGRLSELDRWVRQLHPTAFQRSAAPVTLPSVGERIGRTRLEEILTENLDFDDRDSLVYTLGRDPSDFFLKDEKRTGVMDALTILDHMQSNNGTAFLVAEVRRRLPHVPL